MSLADDYTALREGAAIGSIADRRQLAVAGSERAAYLQGLLTNDIQALQPGRGCYAAWLTPQGRMLTDMDVLESGDMILLDLPAAQAASTLARLDEFLFSEDVQLASLDGTLTGVWTHGPGAPHALEASLGLPGLQTWPDYTLGKAEFQGAPVVIARIDQVGVPGFCAYVEPTGAMALTAALGNAGARVVHRAALEVVRIEAGYPIFGVDMTDDTIPLEAGIEQRAISFSKGCYVGQEVIIRVLHRGHGRVAKKLVGLRIDGQSVAPGARLYSGDRDIGFVTSAAMSPVLGSIALGYVHRDFTEAGSAVQVQDGEGRVAATVSTRPLSAA